MQPNDKRIAWRAGCSPFPRSGEKLFETARCLKASFHLQNWDWLERLKIACKAYRGSRGRLSPSLLPERGSGRRLGRFSVGIFREKLEDISLLRKFIAVVPSWSRCKWSVNLRQQVGQNYFRWGRCTSLRLRSRRYKQRLCATPLRQEDLVRDHHSGKAWQHQPSLKEQNLTALENADWVCSSFALVTGKTVWLITEPNRATTIAILEAP